MGEIRRENGGVAAARECHRRGCDEPARFLVLERYLEETGQGAVEAEAALCREHTTEESPTNLEDASEDSVFRIEPITNVDSAGDADVPYPDLRERCDQREHDQIRERRLLPAVTAGCFASASSVNR